MARYTGPVCRICRRYGEKLMLKGDKCVTKCTLDKRPTPPGAAQARRRKLSDRALQLREKQKARYTYGVLEKQFRRYYKDAVRHPGVTGENLLKFLEARLDNTVYRLGFARTRRQARQLVTHGHILVNDHVLDIPSALLKDGDIVAVRPASRSMEPIKDALTRARRPYPWLETDRGQMAGKFLSMPNREDIPETFREQLIVELYSK